MIRWWERFYMMWDKGLALELTFHEKSWAIQFCIISLWAAVPKSAIALITVLAIAAASAGSTVSHWKTPARTWITICNINSKRKGKQNGSSSVEGLEIINAYFNTERTHLEPCITVNNGVGKSTSCAYQRNLKVKHMNTIKLLCWNCQQKFAQLSDGLKSVNGKINMCIYEIFGALLCHKA